jgi:hypothetical protein
MGHKKGGRALRVHARAHASRVRAPTLYVTISQTCSLASIGLHVLHRFFCNAI